MANKRPRDSPKLKNVWLLLLGNIREDKITKLSNDGYIDPFGFEPHSTCESCFPGKMTKAPFEGHCTRVADVLGLIH